MGHILILIGLAIWGDQRLNFATVFPSKFNFGHPNYHTINVFFCFIFRQKCCKSCLNVAKIINSN